MKNQKIKILFVEDDENLGFVTKDNLEELGYQVEWQKDGQAGINSFVQSKFDVCVFDIMLPVKDGFALAKEVRQKDKKTPILFLSAKGADEDKIKGFNLGADDYVTKPFNMDLLNLRIQALHRRNRSSLDTEQTIFQVGGIKFDFESQIISKGSVSEKLSNKEAEIFKLLCLHKNKVLSRKEALISIWGENDYFKGRSMDVFVARLRKVIKMDSQLEIVTIHGKGFQLNEKAQLK